MSTRPNPPEEDRGIYFSGFAGTNTKWLSPNEISFGATPCGGVATSLGPRDVCAQFERENLIDVMGLGLPPENYDFGGISGGPMLSAIERHDIRTWALAGIIYDGPNSSGGEGESIQGFEVIRARHASFIRPNGSLDRPLWNNGGLYLASAPLLPAR